MKLLKHKIVPKFTPDRLLGLLVAPLLLSSSVVQGASYFSEDFDTKNTQGLVDAGWDINHNEFGLEAGTDFVLAQYPYDAANYENTVWPPGNSGPPGTSFSDPLTGLGLVTPPGVDGVATSKTSGGYLISDSDKAGGSDNIGSLSEFWATTPSFSTIGAAEVWWHADADIDANNNGECIVDLTVSVDGGTTWIQAWAQAEPQRPIKSYNFNINTDPTFEGGTPMGGYPVLGSYSQTKTWDGVHGRWHVKLPDAAKNQANVKVRIRYIEPADSWWIALDNVVVDDNPPPQGSRLILLETFENGIPATWKNDSTQKWGAGALTNMDGTLKMQYSAADDRKINVDLLRFLDMVREIPTEITPVEFLNWSATNFIDYPEQASYHPNSPNDGTLMMMMAGGNYALWQADSTYNISDLDTPAVDLSTATEVFMDFDSEWLNRIYSSSDRNLRQNYLAQVSVDGGVTFTNVFDYQAALSNIGEAPYYMHHYIPVPQAAGKSNVIFRFHAEGLDNGNLLDPEDPDSGTRHAGFWVIDNVRVTVNAPVTVPSITSITVLDGRITVTWPGAEGVVLQKSSDFLNAASWADIAGTSGSSTYSEAQTDTSTFYRLFQP